MKALCLFNLSPTSSHYGFSLCLLQPFTSCSTGLCKSKSNEDKSMMCSLVKALFFFFPHYFSSYLNNDWTYMSFWAKLATLLVTFFQVLRFENLSALPFKSRISRFAPFALICHALFCFWWSKKRRIFIGLPFFITSVPAKMTRLHWFGLA